MLKHQMNILEIFKRTKLHLRIKMKLVSRQHYTIIVSTALYANIGNLLEILNGQCRKTAIQLLLISSAFC